MSARRESQNWDQPNDINSTLNEMFYGKPRGLNPDLNTYGHEDLMLTSNNFRGNEDVLVFPTYHDTYNADYQELSTAASRQNYNSAPNESLFDATPNEGGAANREREEVSNDVGPQMGAHEMQLEDPTPSTSGAGPGERKRKREESGTCDLCSKTLTRISDVKRHKKSVHKNKEEDEFVCELCEEVGKESPYFSRRDALRRHMRNQHFVGLDEDQS